MFYLLKGDNIVYWAYMGLPYQGSSGNGMSIALAGGAGLLAGSCSEQVSSFLALCRSLGSGPLAKPLRDEHLTLRYLIVVY